MEFPLTTANIDLSEVIQDTVGAMFGREPKLVYQLSTKIDGTLIWLLEH